MKKSANKIFIFLVSVVIAILVLVKISGVLNSPYEMFYEGDVRHFRADLIEADKVPVYPNESAIKNVILNPEVYKIYIAYFPNNTENPYYLASTFEIVNKLGIVYRHVFKNDTIGTYKDSDGSSCLVFQSNRKTKCFRSFPINSTDELVPTDIEPVILLLGPLKTNKTAVTVNNYLITLEAKDFTEINRNYNDLDLATDKMLLVLMKDASI
jgi:hypothetical protein